MIMRVTPYTGFEMVYPPEYTHEVKLDEDNYDAEELGNALVEAMIKAHQHPAGIEHFSHFRVQFEREE